MTANLENSAVATGLKRSVFIPIPKKGNAKECSNYHTIALISHAHNTKGHCHPRASSAKTRGFHTQLDEGPETP